MMHACKHSVRTPQGTKSVRTPKTQRFSTVRKKIAVWVNMEEIRHLVGRNRGQDDSVTSREMYLLLLAHSKE